MIRQLMFQELPFSGEISRNGEIRLHGREQFGTVLNHARKALFDKAVQYLVDFLPGDMGPGREFQGFKTRVPQQNEVRARFIRVEPELL